jgi:hypothetical protein
MTQGFFNCLRCNFKKTIYISEFVPECPQCHAKYELLATLYGYHICHDIPLYRLENDPFEKHRMNGIIALARGSGPLHFVCYNQDFFKFLQDLKNQQKIPENAIIELKHKNNE